MLLLPNKEDGNGTSMNVARIRSIVPPTRNFGEFHVEKEKIDDAPSRSSLLLLLLYKEEIFCLVLLLLPSRDLRLFPRGAMCGFLKLDQPAGICVRGSV